jgi:hypothetical protein
MNWFSSHFWLLFDGVGGAFLIALLFFVLQRFFSKPTESRDSTLNVQDSQVMGSPVASGSQVTQHNYFTPAPTPVPVATPANTPTQDKPRPNIVMTAGRIARVIEIAGGVLVEDKNGTVEAILIQFTNEARSDEGTNVGGFVKASLVFRDEQNEILRITGSWLNTLTDAIEFRVEDTHKLVVGVMFRQELLTIDIVRVGGMLRADSHDVSNVQTVLVKLTNAICGDVVYEGRFRITLNPVSIVPEYVGRVDVTLP